MHREGHQTRSGADVEGDVLAAAEHATPERLNAGLAEVNADSYCVTQMYTAETVGLVGLMLGAHPWLGNAIGR